MKKINIGKYNLQYFKRKTKKTFGSIIDYYAYNKKGTISLHYFDKEINVGDILNPYLINNLFHINTIQRQKGTSPHLVAIGSVMHDVNKNSYVWGSGFISSQDIPKSLDPKKICALRGKESVNLLKEKFNILIPNLALGDPAVLTPLVYNNHNKEKIYEVGIVPHYVDADKIPKELYEDSRIKIIDVQQSPENFIDDMLECNFILSSSLHGLILADSYDIPNKWIVLSDRLVGGEFKFIDYYSTTSNPSETCIKINSEALLINAVNNIKEIAEIKTFLLCKESLLRAFPFKKINSTSKIKIKI